MSTPYCQLFFFVLFFNPSSVLFTLIYFFMGEKRAKCFVMLYEAKDEQAAAAVLELNDSLLYLHPIVLLCPLYNNKKRGRENAM